MTAPGGVEVLLHSFLTSQLDLGQLWTSRPGHFTAGKEPRYVLKRKRAEPQSNGCTNVRMDQKVDWTGGRTENFYHQVSNHIRTRHIEHRGQNCLILFRFHFLELRRKTSTKIFIYKNKTKWNLCRRWPGGESSTGYLLHKLHRTKYRDMTHNGTNALPHIFTHRRIPQRYNKYRISTITYDFIYEGWNFNSGNYLFITDTK